MAKRWSEGTNTNIKSPTDSRVIFKLLSLNCLTAFLSLRCLLASRQCKHSLESTLGGSSMTKASPDYVKVQCPIFVPPAADYPTHWVSIRVGRVFECGVQILCFGRGPLVRGGADSSLFFRRPGVGKSAGHQSRLRQPAFAD